MGEFCTNIRGMLPQELRALLADYGEQAFRGDQVFHWIQRMCIQEWHDIKNIGSPTRQYLADKTVLKPLKMLEERVSKDGTRKYLWGLGNNNLIESVLLSYSGDLTRRRSTLCISTQVGCAMGCNFCATGKLGFTRNLDAGEIVSQVLDLTWLKKKENADFKIDNIVYMGMGEPLLNLSAVLKSIRILNNEKGQNIGIRRITVSTCGLVPQIDQLAEEGLDIVLAVSLHAADNKLRDSIMPVNKRYPLEQLIAACKRYTQKTRRRITFEYALIRGVNDQEIHALQLVDLLSGLNANVNLIPVNVVNNTQYSRPRLPEIKNFARLLREKGINAVVREERGSDIEAACGQLAGRVR